MFLNFLFVKFKTAFRQIRFGLLVSYEICDCVKDITRKKGMSPLSFSGELN